LIQVIVVVADHPIQCEPVTAPTGGEQHMSEAPAMDPERRDRLIAEAAYYRAEHRGFVDGDPLQDWLEAEREVDAALHQRAAHPSSGTHANSVGAPTESVGAPTGSVGAPSSDEQASAIRRLETQLDTATGHVEQLTRKLTTAAPAVVAERQKDLERLGRWVASLRESLRKLITRDDRSSEERARDDRSDEERTRDDR
jgi:hypothetical protein